MRVYEVGTATMMASKAIKPVYDVFKEARIQFDESQFVPTVSGYYSDQQNWALTFPAVQQFDPVLYYNKTFKKAGLDRNSRQKPGRIWRTMPQN